MSDAQKIEMLAKALQPFADLLENEYKEDQCFELFIWSSDVAAAKKALKDLENKNG